MDLNEPLTKHVDDTQNNEADATSDGNSPTSLTADRTDAAKVTNAAEVTDELDDRPADFHGPGEGLLIDGQESSIELAIEALAGLDSAAAPDLADEVAARLRTQLSDR